MTSENYEFVKDDKLKSRDDQFCDFVERMFDEEDRPFFVSDEACLYDIFTGDDHEFIARCRKQYGKTLLQGDFGIYIWELLDKLYGNSQVDAARGK